MPRKSIKSNRPSELRQDLVTLDWVAIATGRAKRPHAFATERKPVQDDIASCPFEDLSRSANKPVALYGKSSKDWSLAVIPNKYPAFTDGSKECPVMVPVGPHHVMEGMGFHEVFVLRDHTKPLAELAVGK